MIDLTKLLRKESHKMWEACPQFITRLVVRLNNRFGIYSESEFPTSVKLVGIGGRYYVWNYESS